jgi:hypothetical protein
MFAHAISSTTVVTASRSVNGALASSKMSLCPRVPGSTVTCLALKRAIVWSLTPLCSGASTLLMIAW